MKLRVVKRIRANKNDYLANFSGDYNDTFNSEYTYFLVMPDHTYARIKLNLYYIENWSIWLDIKILFKTVWQGVFERNGI